MYKKRNVIHFVGKSFLTLYCLLVNLGFEFTWKSVKIWSLFVLAYNLLHCDTKIRFIVASHDIFDISGNSDLEQAFKDSSQVKDLINKTLGAMMLRKDNRKARNYVDQDEVKTLVGGYSVT